MNTPKSTPSNDVRRSFLKVHERVAEGDVRQQLPDRAPNWCRREIELRLGNLFGRLKRIRSHRSKRLRQSLPP